MLLYEPAASVNLLSSAALQRRMSSLSGRIMSKQQRTLKQSSRRDTGTHPPSAEKTTPSKWMRVSANATSKATLDKAQQIARQLSELYPSPPIPLDHCSTFQLLVAVMLSAQTTDVKVNQVTPRLFMTAPNAAAMAAMEVGAIQLIIQPIGLAPTKAKNISNMSKLLLERHSGEVPSTFEELEALPGVGHKTASVVMSQAFGHPAFPVDTHIHRLATRWGLSSGESVEQTEADLKALLPPHTWRDVHLQILYFGREHCPAQRHDATKCPICSWAAVAVGAINSTVASGNKAAGAKRTAAVAAVALEQPQGVSVSVATQGVLSSSRRSRRRRSTSTE